MKETVYITGHKNLDLDSICAAYAYARLKNKVDDSREYVAITSSPISRNVEKQLKLAEVPLLPCIMDIYPKVSDVCLSSEGFDGEAPIYDPIQTYTTEKPSVILIYEDKRYAGFLSVEDHILVPK